MEEKENYTTEDRTTDFHWFFDQFDELFKQYGHKFFVIRHKEILGVYDDEQSALQAGCQMYQLGEFIVQEDTGDKASYGIWTPTMYIDD